MDVYYNAKNGITIITIQFCIFPMFITGSDICEDETEDNNK